MLASPAIVNLKIQKQKNWQASLDINLKVIHGPKLKSEYIINTKIFTPREKKNP